MERLELSKQKLLGPKPSAFTNFATSVKFGYQNNIHAILINVKFYSLTFIKIACILF